MCLGSRFAASSRSAIVRATFRMRSWAQAPRPCWVMGTFQALAIRRQFAESAGVAGRHWGRCGRAFGGRKQNVPAVCGARASRGRESWPSFPHFSKYASNWGTRRLGTRSPSSSGIPLTYLKDSRAALAMTDVTSGCGNPPTDGTIQAQGVSRCTKLSNRAQVVWLKRVGLG